MKEGKIEAIALRLGIAVAFLIAAYYIISDVPNIEYHTGPVMFSLYLAFVGGKVSVWLREW